jgi:hypothetical protein
MKGLSVFVIGGVQKFFKGIKLFQLKLLNVFAIPLKNFKGLLKAENSLKLKLKF